MRVVSIPYWLGSKLRGRAQAGPGQAQDGFQSPIGWGLSCECASRQGTTPHVRVSIPYWLGSKLRGVGETANAPFPELVSIPYWLGSKLRDGGRAEDPAVGGRFQSPIGWGLSCESGGPGHTTPAGWSFNPLLVGV